MYITSPDVVFSQNKIYIFKKTFNAKKSGHCTFNITAEVRYKLYVDSALVSAGPQKGARGEKFFDTICIDEYLKDGENEIVIEVCQLQNEMDPNFFSCLRSVHRTGAMMLAVWGNYTDDENEFPIVTDKTWLVTEKKTTQIASGLTGRPGFLAINEYVTPNASLDWKNAQELEEVDMAGGKNNEYGILPRWVLKERSISPLYYKSRCVNILEEKKNIYDAYEMTVGYVRVKFSGKGTLKLYYAECFSTVGDNGRLVKGDRADINADSTTNCKFDIIECDGEGQWESFWVRDFRYITVEASGTASADLIYYIETGYPIKGTVTADFDNEKDNKLWNISMRTLQLCMQETYVDCPYYEQLQYAMDTYIQMIFSYQVTSDRLLAENAINLFRKSQDDEGYLPSRYPSIQHQIIPGFALFYIMMVYEHYIRFGDEKLVKENIFCIEKLLEVFEKNIDETGLVKKLDYWNFVDWSAGWYGGIPVVGENQPQAIYSLMFAYVLRQCAYLEKVLNRSYSAYEKRADDIVEKVKSTCFNEEEGIFANSPAKAHFSQQMQVWAVLTDCVNDEQGREILEKSFSLKEKSTIGFDHILMRALDKVGMYEEKREQILDPYRKLLDFNCTTIPETPFVSTRSECHAWGSHVLYEFTVYDLGVSWENNKYASEIRIKPYIKMRNKAKGKVCTAFGDVFVEWSKGDKFKLELYMPENVKKIITLPSGKVIETTDNYMLIEE